MGPVVRLRSAVCLLDRFPALAGVDLEVAAGEVVLLRGANGAGKTTLLRALAGLVPVVAGEAEVLGHDLRRDRRAVRPSVGLLGHGTGLYDDLTVAENLDLAAAFRRPFLSLLRRSRGVDDRVAEALATVGLAGDAGKPAGILSHGQKQWLEIGMLLVQDPKLLLLDEPVAGMSREERTRTGELLHLIAQSRTVVVVEHDMEFLRRFARCVTVMHEGKVLCEGSVADVQADPRVQEVYLGRSGDTRGRVEAH